MWLLTISCSKKTKEIQQYQPDEFSRSLDKLSDDLVWVENCNVTYSKVLADLKNVKENFAKVTAEHKVNFPQKEEFKKRFNNLEKEAEFIMQACADEKNPSPEQVTKDKLEAAVMEWRVRIDDIRKNLLSVDPRNKNISPATSNGVSVSSLTAAGLIFQDGLESYLPKMIVVPSGSFIMGGTDEENARLDVEPFASEYSKPLHQVTIAKSLAVGINEVTLGQFRQFAKETNYKPLDGCRCWIANQESRMLPVKGADYTNPGFPQTDNDPVVCITKEVANDYAQWLSQKTGKKYRLPSESEWEYFARAGTQTTYYWGNDPKDACGYANTYDLSSKAINTYTSDGFVFPNTDCTDGFPYTAPVGKFQPNKFGLYDIAGNAREWVADDWYPNYNGAPVNGEPRTNGYAMFGITRGGAWLYRIRNLRSAYRNSYFSSEVRTNMWGFRVVREI